METNGKPKKDGSINGSMEGLPEKSEYKNKNKRKQNTSRGRGEGEEN